MASIIDGGWIVGVVAALLFVLGVVVGRVTRGVPWSLAEVRNVIEMLVQEAEQTMAQEAGEERLSWVLARADALGITRYVPAALLSAMIESAVFVINRMREGQAERSFELKDTSMWRDKGRLL